MRMTKAIFVKRFTELCKEFGLDPKTTVVSSGGALLLHGLRRFTDDFDLDVPKEVFESFRNKGTLEMFGDKEIINLTDDISLHVITPDLKVVFEEGIPTYSVSELLVFKKTLLYSVGRVHQKREQDRADIAMLEMKLKSSKKGNTIGFK